MKYEMRQPCPKCPFRSDVKPYITPTRAREILTGNAEFACHATLDYAHDDEDGEGKETPKTQHCAGVLICLEHDERPHQMMRIAESLRFYDRTKLDMDAPVYRGVREAIEAHKRKKPAAGSAKRLTSTVGEDGRGRA